MFYDNQGVGSLAKHQVLHSRIKHVQIDFHFIRERVLGREICVVYISIHEQTTHIMTNDFAHFLDLRTKITILDRDMSLKDGDNLSCNLVYLD